MRKIISILLCLVIYIEAFASAQDSTSVNARTWKVLDPIERYVTSDAVSSTQAAEFLTNFPSFSRASFSLIQQDESKALTPETGNSRTVGRFDAESFRRLHKHDAVKGRVNYTRALKRNVLFNETADYELLEPYVLIDTISGDVQHEQYLFSGAYTNKRDHLVWTLAGSYKATHEYRTADPRPWDISSDLYASGSLGWTFGNGYILAYGGYRKYYQRQDVTFMSTLGANTALFHATGLGTDYYRFRSTGIFAATRYIGHGARSGLMAQLGPINTGLSYEYLEVTRHLSNQNEAPLGTLATSGLHAFANIKASDVLAFSITYSLAGKDGMENIIDCASSGIYQSLKSMRMYSKMTHSAELSALMNVRRKDALWSIMPSFGVISSYEEYLSPEARSQYTLLQGKLHASFLKRCQKWIYDIHAEAMYSNSVMQECSLSRGDVKMLSHYMDKFQTRTSGHTGINIEVSAQRELRNGIAAYSRLCLSGMQYAETERMLGCSISIGISF